MLPEAIQNYEFIFKKIMTSDQFTQISTDTLLQILPPGKSHQFVTADLWKRVKEMVDQETFKEVFENDKGKIFEKIAVKLCYDQKLPGRAKLLLKSAIIDRKIGLEENNTMV